ncbi:MAG: benzoyl-CoA reductase subunit C [Myxococcales bacterium]|nr:benzoyl-CoA reductase subunit C [Myxococcales bacterium]MCB9580094.1 benzoyl-CoA reductase subunit C [Polyangiaceae bacterium]
MTEAQVATEQDPAGAILERARELVDDLSFGAVKSWKEKNPGALAVGTLPIYTPRPLFEAMGALPVGVFGGGDQLDIIRGDSYFQSYICHIPRSVVEMALSGRLDVMDAMVFPSICDVIRNLGGMWAMLFPDRYAAYLDLPQNFDPEVGGRFYAQDLRRIAGELEKRGAKPLDADRLRTAIAEENARRAALEELDALRREEPWRVRASEAYLIARAGSMMLAKDHEALVREFTSAVKDRQTRVYDNVRVVVRGSFCEQPPLGLIKTLEAAGCDIVDDDFQLGLRFIEGAIETPAEQDPLESLALAYLRRGTATASRYIGEEEKGAALIECVKQAKAEGVIFAAASFCDPALLDQPMLESALDRAKIPHTSLKFSENTGQFQVIREQAGAFSDAVKLWGSAA